MKSRLLKLCSMILVLTMLVNILPMQALALDLNPAEPGGAIDTTPSTDNLAATAGSLTNEPATIVAEITENRTQFSKEYKLSNGLHMAVVYPEAVHYEDNGQWLDIDNTLKAVGSGATGTYTNKAGAWNAIFPQQLNKDNQVTIVMAGYTVSFGMAGELRKNNLPVEDDELVTASIIGNDTAADTTLTVTDMQSTIAQIQELDYSAAKASTEHPEIIRDKLNSRLVYNNVYNNTDIIYDLSSYQLKESIVISQYDPLVQGYRYTLETGSLVPVLNDDGSIDLVDMAANEVVMSMPAPYMIDNAGAVSKDVDVSLVRSGEAYALTYQMPMEWLADAERAWPVVLDPVISATSHYSNILDIFISDNIAPDYNSGGLYVGYNGFYGRIRTFIQYVDLPDLTSADVIVNASLSLLRFGGSSTASVIEAHKVEDTWHSRTITWANQPAYDPIVEDYVSANSNTRYSWDITDIAREWYEGENTGVMLKVSDAVEKGGVENWQKFYSIEYDFQDTSIGPYLQIVFRNNNGIESYWDYTASSAGRAGTGYVNNYSGNLTWIHNDIGFGGNRMPVSISHVYNSNDSAMNTFGMGYGWRTNFSQAVSVWDQNSAYYVWEDGDGTKHYFLKESAGIYKDEDGLELTLTDTGSGTAKYRIQDKNGNSSYFDTQGRLSKVENNQATKSNITITYLSTASKLISKITDGAGRVYNFTYTGNLLTRISYVGKGTTELFYVAFGYTGSRLTSVTDKDGKVCRYTYDSANLLTAAQDIDSYKLTYTYSAGSPKRVVGISEHDGTVAGGSMTVEYSHNQTTFTDHNGNVQIMQFNDWGNVVSVQDNEGRAQHAQYARNQYTETTKGNQLTLTSKMQNTVSNMLSDSSFETGNPWSKNVSTITMSRTTATAYIGSYSLKVDSTASGATNGAYFPYVYVDPGETITFSAYVKSTGTPIQLAFHCLYEGYNFLVYGEVLQPTDEWVRAEVSYTNDQDITLRLVGYVFNKAPGTSYIDCVQAEIQPTASRYNLIQNGDFSNTSAWSSSAGRTTVTATAAPQLDGNVYKITGSPTATRYITQTVNVSGVKGDTYVLAGWAKGDAAPLTNDKRAFGLKAIFNNTDGTKTERVVHFNTACDSQNNWQYAATPAVADKPYSSITVQIVYNYNVNTVYFDGIQLFKEEFGSSYTYDDDGNVKSVVDLQKQTTTYEYDTNNNLTKIIQNNKAKVTYTYDAYHNVLTATTLEGIVYQFTYDTYGNNTEVKIAHNKLNYSPKVLSSSAAYSSDGNVLVSTKDALDKITNYGYNINTNVLEWVQYPEDTEETRTIFTYDTMYRLATATSDVGGDYTLTASYTYTDDLLTAIETGSTKYSFSYGDFSQRSSIQIGSRNLASYTYTARDRYLDVLTYGNGDKVDYTYDDMGRVILETFEDGDTVAYEYDNNGALAKVTDSETGITTKYYYDFTDRLMKYVETGTDYSHSVGYEYDTLNNLTLLVETINGVAHTTSYTYDDDNRIILTATDDVSEDYEYNQFGLLGTTSKYYNGTMIEGDTYSYYQSSSGGGSGQVRVHTIDSWSYTRELIYTYDDNGNITAVRDESAAYSYVYDTANQLIRENNQAAGKTWIWIYDNAGNILSRSEYAYTTGALGTPIETVRYAYGDASWGDLLTAYDGNAITYDGIGNPLSDGTWAYTWQHGRELASMSDGTTTWTYTYDANGMRTGRSNGTDTYTYVYNGGRLVQMTKGSDTLFFTYTAGGAPLAVKYNGEYYFYVSTIQGDTLMLFNTDREIVLDYTYDAWGNIIAITGPMADTLGTLNPLTYRGYVYDHETGLYYLQSRYYNPEWGRFLNADALVSTGGLLGNNMFAYCGNNPVNNVDPTGHVYCKISFDAFMPFDITPIFVGCVGFSGSGEIKIAKKESAATEDAISTVGSKFSEVAKSVGNNITASFGIGLGVYGETNVYDTFELSGGLVYDVFNISLTDGELSVQERSYYGASVGFSIFEAGVSHEMYRDYHSDSFPNQFYEVDTPDVFTIFSFGAYFFGGVSVTIGFDIASFFKDIDSIF